MANLIGSTFSGYVVGLPAFLDEAANNVGKYWRLVEFGSHGFVGKYLGGLWSSDAYGGGLLSPFGEGRDQMFVPFGPQGQGVGGANEDLAKAAALRALGYLAATHQLATSGALDRDKSPSQFAAYRSLWWRIEKGLPGPTLGIVTQEFRAMEAYQGAAVAFQVVEKERQALNQVFGAMSVFSERGRRQSILDLRRGRRTPGLLAGEEFAARRGFITGQVLSQGTRSLGNTVDQVLRHELTIVNRLLAEQLAQEVASRIGQKKIRQAVSTYALQEATLDPKNRFPT